MEFSNQPLPQTYSLGGHALKSGMPVRDLFSQQTRRIGFVSLLATFLLIPCGYAESEDYEPDVVNLRASEILPGSVIKGPNHAVDEDLVNRGYMNHYRITTPFGEFEATSNVELAVRIQEINAIVALRAKSKLGVATQAAAEGVTSSVKTIGTVVTRPVDTVKGLPSGVSRLFKRTTRKVSDTYDKAKTAVQDDGDQHATQSSDGKADATNGDKTDIADVASETAVDWGKKYLGLNASYRKLAAELQVDPYTDNDILRKELKDMAKVAAAASFGTKLITPGLPSYLGIVTDVQKLVWNMDPLDLKLRNEQTLEKLGMDKTLISQFMENPHYRLSGQTLVTSALDTLGEVEESDVLLRGAAEAESPSEARFQSRLIQFLSLYHAKRTPLARIVETDRFPLAIASDQRVILFAAVDYIPWTQDVDAAAAAFSSAAQQSGSAGSVDLWIDGQASQRARDALQKRGWSMHERAFTVFEDS